MSSVSQYVAQLLNDSGVAYFNPTGVQWKLTYSTAPSTPDSLVTVFDTGGEPDGRLMGSGETVFHPTVQVRVRAVDYTAAHDKCLAVKALFDTIIRTPITVNAVLKKFQSITTYTYPVFIGQETDKNRQVFVLNARISFTE